MDDDSLALIDLTDETIRTLTVANSISFYIVNWIGLFVLIWLVFRIRHTSDDTYLKYECACIVGVWILFSILQYSTFLYISNVTCEKHGDETGSDASKINHRYAIVNKIFYCIILTRDLLCLVIMLFYQCRVQN